MSEDLGPGYSAGALPTQQHARGFVGDRTVAGLAVIVDGLWTVGVARVASGGRGAKTRIMGRGAAGISWMCRKDVRVWRDAMLSG